MGSITGGIAGLALGPVGLAPPSAQAGVDDSNLLETVKPGVPVVDPQSGEIRGFTRVETSSQFELGTSSNAAQAVLGRLEREATN